MEYQDRDIDVGHTLKYDNISCYLFEKFFVLGLSEDNETDLDVLFQYPVPVPDEEEISRYDMPKNQFLSYCYPQPIIDEMKLNQNIEKVMEPFAEMQKRDRSFVFNYATDDLRMCYGVCVLNWEPLHIKPSLLSQSKKKNEDNKRNNKNKKNMKKYPQLAADDYDYDYENFDKGIATPRCYCLITYSTAFSLMFQFLYAVIMKERLFFQGMLGMVEHNFKNSSTHRIIKKLKSFSVENNREPIHIMYKDNTVHNFFFETGTDHDGHIAIWAFEIALKLIDIKNLMWLLGMIMMGYSVAVRSNSIGSCTAVILSLVVMLRPFSFQGTMVTIMPRTCDPDVFSSPCPFLFGTHLSLEQLGTICSPDTIRLDLDGEEAVCLIGKTDTVQWDFPFGTEMLMDPLKRIVKRAKRWLFTPIIVLDIMHIVKLYQCYFIYKLVAKLHCDPETEINDCRDLNLLDPDILSHSYNKKEKKFLKWFLGTMHANYFVGKFVEISNMMQVRSESERTFECMKADMFRYLFKQNIKQQKNGTISNNKDENKHKKRHRHHHHHRNGSGSSRSSSSRSSSGGGGGGGGGGTHRLMI